VSAVLTAQEPSAKYLVNLQPPLVRHFDLIAQAPGGVARLRELILTLAVQGKLVPQDPSDEPASELIKKIRAEKDRLIAEGKIKRDKPLAEITDEEKPFELPKEWEWVPLQFIGYTQTGTTPDKKNPQMYGGDIPFIKPGDIYPNHVDYSNEALSEAGLADSGRLAPAGSLLMVCIGTIGKSNLIERACSFNQQINSVTPLCCSPEYVKLFCRSPFFQAEAWARSSITTISILNKGKWEAIPVALPPLAEQSRIVARVEELMQLCDALEASGQLEAQQHTQLVGTLLGTLTQSETPEALADNWQRIATHFDVLLDRPEAVDALEQTILQLAVRGLLVPQDPTDEPASVLLQKIRTEKDHLIAQGKIKRDKPLPPITDEEKPFALPQGWQWVRFDELTHPLKPIAYGVLVPGPDVETGIPFVRIADLSLDSPASKPEKSISAEIDAQFQRTRLEGGEILMGVVGSIGKLGVAPATWAGANIARAICRIVPADSGLNEFVLFLLQTKFMQESFAGDTRTLAQPTLNVGLIRAALTPLPPPAEQSRIVTRVNELRSLCADLRQRLSAAQSMQGHLADALVAV
jgi:type I restriction enzyme S subunit